MRYKITFSYDGSKFCGFQRQKNVRSVQYEIEQALKSIYNKEILIKGSGRTDAKVHAYNQVAHFDIDYKVDNLKNKLNTILNPDILIKKIERVKDTFHARRSVKKKEYIYKINLGIYDEKLLNYVYQTKYKLDILLMKDASMLFIGTHDFRNFVAGTRDDYVSTILKIKFKKRKNILEIHFIGTGFYRYMVRNLVGALLEVGKCKIDKSIIESMLKHPEVEKVLPTADACGLYLSKIWYN